MPCALRDEEGEDLIMIRMEITEPLNSLKSILEDTIPGVAELTFTLQDGPELDGNKSLVQHGVVGEGEVVIHLELKDDEKGKRLDIVDVLKPADDEFPEPGKTDDQNQKSTSINEIPADGQDNASGTSSQLKAKKPRQRKKKPVASRNDSMKMEQPKTNIPNSLPKPKPIQDTPTGPNSQIQLWQFLLELLTDHSFLNAIQWVGNEGEFKLNDPEMVAKLWGTRKNRPQMNYEKLSRALRYYYDGDMIAKVPGHKFVFKFICDLKFLIGYSAKELNKLVHEAADEIRSGLSKNELRNPQPILIESEYN